MSCFVREKGELVGSGSLIIGPTAEVISNLKGLHEVRTIYRQHSFEPS